MTLRGKQATPEAMEPRNPGLSSFRPLVERPGLSGRNRTVGPAQAASFERQEGENKLAVRS
jgi:hypothetical protein